MRREIIAEAELAAPMDRVWSACTDVAAAVPYLHGCTGITMLTEPPFGAGTLWEERRRVMGSDVSMTLLVTAIRRPGAGAGDSAEERLASGDVPAIDWGTKAGVAYYDNSWTTGGGQYASRFEVEAVSGGAATRIAIRVRLARATLLARVQFALFGGMMRRMLAADLEGLRRCVADRARGGGVAPAQGVAV